MVLNISDDQFEKLIKLTYLGMWVADANFQQTETSLKEIEQLIFQEAKERKAFQNLIQYNETEKRYYPTNVLHEDEVINNYLDDYEENCFWEELIDRLTKKSLIEEYGLEEILKMDSSRRMEAEKLLIEKYQTEFENNGIKNLKIEI